MKSNLNQLVSILLILSLLFLILISCSNPDSVINEESNPEETETAPETDPAYYQTLENDFGGQVFRVLGVVSKDYSQFNNFEIYSEAEDGEVVNDAIFRRNSRIEEKYNVKIEQTLDEEPQTLIKKVITSGDDLFDLYFVQLRFAGSMVTNAYNLNLYDLPYVDFTQPYWSEEVNNSISIDGRLYFTVSDFSLEDKNRTYILVYNRDMVKDFGMESIEDGIHNGTWTFERFTEMCAKVSSDLDGDSDLDANDRWGLGMDSPIAIVTFAAGFGGHLVEKDDNDLPVITAGTETMIQYASELFDSFNQSPSIYSNNEKRIMEGVDYDFTQIPYVMFEEQRLLFMTSFPHMLKNMSDTCDFDYGVIAFPKFDESQENYYTLADPFASTVFGVPAISGNSNFVGFMLEVLSGYSTETTLKAFYEVSCKIKYTYDTTSAEMLDLIFNNIVYDLGVMYDWGGIYSRLLYKIMDNKSNTYVSDFASIESKAITAMQKTVDEILLNK